MILFLSIINETVSFNVPAIMEYFFTAVVIMHSGIAFSIKTTCNVAFYSNQTEPS